MIHKQESTIRYIRERRCASGGYCFYRLNEPNAGDTFHALASLELLGALPDNDLLTLKYLHLFQHLDGQFSNVHIGHAVIRSLKIFGERPHIDPTGWILSLLGPPGAGNHPVESSSLFENLYLLMDLCTVTGSAIPPGQRAGIIDAVLRYRHADSGFGYPDSTIIGTSHALAILAGLGYPVSLAGSAAFLTQCEDPSFGFVAVPGSLTGYLEHVHAGILACSAIGYCSPVFVQCEEFIRKCWCENGGYARSIFGGSATLENTYLALAARTTIDCMRNDPGSQMAGGPRRCCD